MRVGPIIAAVALIIIASMPTTADAAARNQTFCYFFFGDVNDLGWTFRFNEGRLAFHRHLRDDLKLDIASRVEKNVFFSEDKKGIIATNVNVHKCSVIIANNRLLLGDDVESVAKQYPHVHFVVVNDEEVETNDGRQSNLLYIGVRSDLAFYTAGAAAATYTKSCIAFIAAHDDKKNAYDAANGFALGVRSKNDQVKLHIVPMQNWYWPVQEVIAANYFLESLGCDVIARYTDSPDVDTFVANKPNRGRAVSVGIHSELNRYIGDSVLVSIFNDWLVPLKDVLTPIINNGQFNFTKRYLYNPVISSISTAIDDEFDDVENAVQVAASYVQNRESIFCGSFTTVHGQVLKHTGTPPNNCFSYNTPLGSLARFDNVVHHQHWVDTETCAPGTFYSYGMDNVSDYVLQCIPCDVDSFSAVQGSSSCSPCKNGTISLSGSAECHLAPLVENQASVVITASIAAVFGSILLVVFVCGIIYWRHVRKKVHHAPTQLPVTLVVVKIDQLSSLHQAYPASMKKAMEIFTDIVKRELNDGNGYLAQSMPDDVLVIAFADMIDAALFCITLNRSLHHADWPTQLISTKPEVRDVYNGLVVTCVLSHCVDDLECRYSSLQQVYTYHGSSLDDAVTLLEVAPSGHILVPNDALKHLRTCAAFTSLVEREILTTPFSIPGAGGAAAGAGAGSSMRSQGSDGGANINLSQQLKSSKMFTIIPAELGGRGFDTRVPAQSSAQYSSELASTESSGHENDGGYAGGSHTAASGSKGASKDDEVACKKLLIKESSKGRSRKPPLPTAATASEAVTASHVLRVIDVLFSKSEKQMNRKHVLSNLCQSWNVPADSSDSLRIRMIRLSEVLASAIGQRGLYGDAHTVSATSSLMTDHDNWEDGGNTSARKDHNNTSGTLFAPPGGELRETTPAATAGAGNNGGGETHIVVRATAREE